MLAEGQKGNPVSIYYRSDRQKWVVDAVWPDGERTRRLMPNLPTAKRVWKKISEAIVDEDSIWLGLRRRLRLTPESKRDGITFHELADTYYANYCVTNNRDAKAKAYRLSILKRHISDVPAGKVTLRHVDRFIVNRKKDNVTNSTINCDLTTLRHMYAWAQKRGYIGVNNLAAIDSLECVQWEGERPDESVIDKIFSNVRQKYVPIFMFIRHTGCRISEATSLTWDQINMSDKSVLFPGRKTKNGKSRPVPLPASVIAALAATPRLGTHVFSMRQDMMVAWNRHSLANVWRAARSKVLDLVGQSSQLRVHDLRHAYAIKLAEDGCPMHFISAVLGHSSVEFTAKRYARYSPESAKNAVIKFLNQKYAEYASVAAPAF